jgi:hypothetical protein
MANPFAGVVSFNGINGTVLQRGISISTDPLAGGGTVLASVSAAGGGPVGGMVIGEWQAGATMQGGEILAARRLVFLSGSREHAGTTENPSSSQIAGLYDLNPDGERMFLNSVIYMVPEPSTYALLGLGALALLMRWRKS